MSTFIFSAPIFGYQRKESFTKLQLKSLITHIDFSNQLMWLSGTAQREGLGGL